jgi:hypothetical protein
VKIFYLDEAGDLQDLPEKPTANPDHQPVFVLGGLIIDYARLDSLTLDFLALKRRFFPNLAYRSEALLDTVLPEIKGAYIRRTIVQGGRNARRHMLGFLDHVFTLFENNSVAIAARIWVKAPGKSLKSTPMYTSSVQRLYEVYDHYLTTQEDYGLCLIDSRSKGLNVPVAHSVFTQKFKTAPRYPRVLELPGFVHSDNHVGIQLADVLCSALLAPTAGQTYCSGQVMNIHADAGYALLKQRYGKRLQDLQYRYVDTVGHWRGGITVADGIGKKSAALLFK